MNSFFNADFFINNRRRLIEEYSDKLPLVVAGNGLIQRGGDSTYSFSQDGNFWYLTGIDLPDLILVLDKSETYLICPQRSAVREAFDGKIDAEQIKCRSGIAEVYFGAKGWERLNRRLKHVGVASALAPPPSYIDTLGFYTNPARASLYDQLMTQVNKIHDVTPGLVSMRTIKQTPEIAAIKKAISITGETMKFVLSKKQLNAYSYEYEVEANIRAGFRTRGASGDGFEPIVAAGKNAATLHNVSNSGRLNKKQLLLVDIGAEVEHYSADITRVYSLSQPSSRQSQIFEAVKDVQQFAIGLLRPGVLLKTYEAEVADYLGKQLKALGLIKTLDLGAIRQHYPHSASHFLGLNVHDIGEYSSPLRPGTVLTVEPGIYVAKENIGVRIEDDILITEKGNLVLSKKIPISL